MNDNNLNYLVGNNINSLNKNKENTIDYLNKKKKGEIDSLNKNKKDEFKNIEDKSKNREGKFKNKEHALLSASSSHKWLNCTPSAILELEVENKETESAKEGTVAHKLCEHKLKTALNISSKKSESHIISKKSKSEHDSPYYSEEMETHALEYVQFILEQLNICKQSCKDPLVLIEERLEFSDYVEEGFGTADCIIIADEKLHIVDFKYGVGVLVSAEDNPQMKLYALGALQKYDSLYDIEQVSMTIFQPRRDNVDTWTICVDDLINWAENELRPKAKKAYKGEGEFACGQWCTFCRVAHRCGFRADENLKLAKWEFGLPPLLSDEEIEEIIIKLPGLTKWAEEIMVYASERAINEGKEWEGFKVVQGRSNRKYKDEKAVAKVAMENGYEDIYKKTLIPITEMEKLMGKSKFSDVMAGLVYKPDGKLVLVPNSDKRKAVNLSDVNKEFKNN